ncbi:hypothetical protein [Polyangium aurulentum]|uniref:hypothetical protein n=1 Tax=Polyangium aurulentum TaxID=2567896 RepID=UPI0010AE00ED|nr:hypothetical protein [Polyangium aurulentum]UQA60204.1 hypothetical protein E8A73_006910 [Polyangium aurulentum]
MQGLAAEVAEREAQVTDALREHVPTALGERLSNGRTAAATPASTAEELTTAEGELTAYRDALDEAIGLVPDIERAQRVLPDEAPELVPRDDLRPWLNFYPRDVLGEDLASLARAFESSVRAVGEEPSIERLNEFDWRARFRAFGAPFSVLAQLGFDSNRGPAEIRMTVATSVAPGTPHLRLRPETLVHGIAKPLGIVREVEIGDEHFDSLFLIETDPEAAQRLLTKPVRRALLEVAHYDVPTLLVGYGVAEINFRFEPTERSLRGATIALAEIRAAEIRLALLR